MSVLIVLVKSLISMTKIPFSLGDFYQVFIGKKTGFSYSLYLHVWLICRYGKYVSQSERGVSHTIPVEF